MFYEKIKVTELIQTCSVSPSQWDGKAKDSNGNHYELYFRYRSHRFTIKITETDNVEFNKAVEINFTQPFLMYTYYPDMEEDSEMSEEKMKELSSHILDYSEL